MPSKFFSWFNQGLVIWLHIFNNPATIVKVTLGGLLILLIGLFFRALHLSRRAEREINILKEKHRQEFENLFQAVNHAGQVPIATRIVGLNHLLSLGIDKNIKFLLRQYEAQDWNTSRFILDLSGMKKVELKWQLEQVNLLLDSIRTVLKENNYKQQDE